MRPRALVSWLLAGALVSGCSPAPPARLAEEATSGRAPALATFRVKEHLGHRSDDALVHFDFDVATTAADLRLTDAAGAPLPAQFTGIARAAGRTRGTVWTLVSLASMSEIALQLRAGRAAALPGASIVEERDKLVLRNDRIAVALPRWPGTLGAPTDLASIPPPLRSVRQADGAWLCDARWVNEGAPLHVREAITTVIEPGPVRASVRQRLTLSDGQKYEAIVTLAAKQEAALVTESSDIDAPRAALRLSMQPGLAADHVVSYNHAIPAEKVNPWALMDTRASAAEERVVLGLRPWSFWWLPRVSEWAGFYREGDGPFAGVALLRPSRWSPDGWTGFQRTEVPVTARAGGGLDISFALAAGPVSTASGVSGPLPLHREWALTAGDRRTGGPPETRLRRILLDQAEFPLDEVKDYGFDFTPPPNAGAGAHLFLNRAQIDRARAQARTDPAAAARVKAAIAYLDRCGGLQETLRNEGPEAFYKRYRGHSLVEVLPDAYLGSSDPKYGELLAAAVKGEAREIVETFLEAPTRPSIGAYGPWFSETITRLVLDHDLVTGAGLLTPEDEAAVRAALVFGARVLSHPDYWNRSRSLMSANPNMHSSIVLPLGILGLALRGHPEAAGWLRAAEAELERELSEWISPGGAWIENPSYQVASLDGMFLFAEAIRAAGGKDWFSDPRLRDTMDYFGFVLTPPDRRFPPKRAAGEPSPMVLPSIGDAFSGMATPFNGWMARATADTDPAYSARQQFFWRGQASHHSNGGRAKGLTLGLTDPALPAAPPRQTSRAFPGFGSVMRTSWTDAGASYVAHRTGPNDHHYHHDQGSFVYYAKGAPLCLDPGNNYHPVPRTQAWEHNLVSFDDAASPRHFAGRGKLVELRSLPRFLDYSHGETAGYGGQRSSRHLLLVKAENPLGPNYVIVRDTTEGGAGQSYHWNLWCLARAPEISGKLVHFPGQMGVDLDVHLLSPAAPQIAKDRFQWSYTVPVWGDFSEDLRAVRVTKVGSAEDFFAVLHPRAAGEGAPRVAPLAGGAGVRSRHDEGTDWVLHTPGKEAIAEEGDVRLAGEIALARKYRNGAIRLVVMAGVARKGASARAGGWSLTSAGPAAIEIGGGRVIGESSGDAHTAVIAAPRSLTAARVTLDGKPLSATRGARTITIDLPAGDHVFEIALR